MTARPLVIQPPALRSATGKVAFRNSRLIVPQRPNVRQVMASPPSVTTTTAHTISSPRHWPSTTKNDPASVAGSFFSYLCAGGIVCGASYPNDQFVGFSHVNYGSFTSANFYRVAFYHYGSELEIFTKGDGKKFLVKIDDQYVSLTPVALASDGNLYYYYIPFGSAAVRRIDFISQGSGGFGGVFTGQTDMIMPAPARGPRTIVIGDSFAEGTGTASSGPTSYINSFADAMGWDDVWASGVGSTGYVAAPAPKIAFGSRASTDIYPFSPDVVMITGGINDGSGYATEYAAAVALYAGIQQNLPLAALIVVDPFWRNSVTTFPASFIATRKAIKDAASAVGALLVSVTEAALPFGYTPIATTLSASAAQFAATIQTAAPLAPEGHYAFADGTRVHIKTVAGGSFIATLDGTLPAAQSNGAAITQVGDCLWTGTGHVGSTSGYGSSDVLVSSDSTHPSQAGHDAIGFLLAQQLIAAMAPS